MHQVGFDKSQVVIGKSGLVQFCHSRDKETAGAYYDKYKDFKFILAASVLFK